jgi:hypothetical protein
MVLPKLKRKREGREGPPLPTRRDDVGSDQGLEVAPKGLLC